MPDTPAPMDLVRVVKQEEKGSDVNLATYLLMDAFDDEYEGAVIVSNDSDLAEPIRLVRTRFKKRVIVLHPCSNGNRTPNQKLRIAAGLRSGKPSMVVEDRLLPACQFPPRLRDAGGGFHKPSGW